MIAGGINDGPGSMTIQRMLKICSVIGLVLLVFFALGPAKYTPRSGLGWQIDHFVGYLVFTLVFCLAWPRPVMVGLGLLIFAVLLEGLQAFPPDRSSNVMAAIDSAGGVLAGALLAEFFFRGRRRLQSKSTARNTRHQG